jgi:hypothetical protein
MNIERYIACLNIEHYKKLLETDIDETKREVVIAAASCQRAGEFG